MKKVLLEIFDRLKKSFSNQDWWPGNTKDEIIIGAILTQNTNWKNVEKSIENLRDNNLLSLKKIKDLNIIRLEELIRPSGFYKVKALYLKEVAKNLHPSKIKESNLKDARKELLLMKGIGKETADSILLYAFEKPIFVVDAYTKRIFSRIGFIDKSDKYDNVQDFFMDNLPSNTKLFNEYHALIVILAKNFCSKKNPLCDDCPIGDLCKNSQISKVVK